MTPIENDNTNDFLNIKGNALEAALVLDNVLLPLLQMSDANGKSTLRSSLYSTYAKKFASAVYRFLDQESKRIQLDLCPNIVGDDIESILADKDKVNIVEKQALSWNSIIHDAIEAELEMNQQTSKGPMDEIDFWRKRHIILSDLMERIKGVDVDMVRQVLRRSQSFVQSKLEERIRIVTKLQVEAADNANFLGTLERHIRTLQDTPIHVAIDSISSLVDGMKMIWIVSRHYNRDERMFPLMQLVSKQIECKVRAAIDLNRLHENNIDSIRNDIMHSKTLMELWKSSYLKTRASLENTSGGLRRWEFDQALLFGTTDYMCIILEDLIEMIGVILEFEPRVFRMLGNDDTIKMVIIQIQKLFDILISVPFDIFHPNFNDDWVLTKKKFYVCVEKIENATEVSIKHIFRQLLSSEKAFDLANKMRNMIARESIRQILNERYIDILNQYERELDQLSLFFTANKKDNPTCMKYQKSVGLAAWAHQLYLRAKRSILLLRQQDDMISSHRGKKIKQRYLQFAKDIDDFKTSIFDSWCSSVHQICRDGMSYPVLRIRKKQLEVNFDHRFKSILIEARQFQALGFTVPPEIDDFVLQQGTLDR
jgi:dynein heavy chain